MNRFLLTRDIFLLLLYTCTSIFALIGNGLICRISLQRRHPSFSQIATKIPLSTTCLFLLNLAIADALAGSMILFQLLFCSRFFLEYSRIGPYLCIFSKFIQVLAYNASTLTICVIAFDRYRLVQNPLKQLCRRQMCRAILFTWLFSSIFAASCLVSMKVHTYFYSHQKLISCQVLFPVANRFINSDRIRKIRVLCLIILFYILPLLTISILCLLTMRTIARRSIIGVQQFPTFEQSRTRSIRLLMAIMIVFALSHLPVHSIHLRDFYYPSSKSSSSGRPMRTYPCNDSTIYLLFYWLGISSCCHNPIIYSWFNRRVRTLTWNLFRSILFCRRSEH